MKLFVTRLALLGGALFAGSLLPLSPLFAKPTSHAVRHKYPQIPGLTDQFGDYRGVFQALTDPVIINAAKLTELGDEEEVLGLTLGGQSRAYPARFIAWHHIVNDTLGGKPVAVTYCSVCNSGVAYNPVVDGTRRKFQVFGLYRGVMAMIDESNNTVWSHLAGEALIGPDKGKSLETYPVINTTWGEWKRLHPATTTPRWEAAYRRYYTSRMVSGKNFMPPYFRSTMNGLRDDRLNSFALVVGVRIGTTARAYPFTALQQAHGCVDETMAGTPLVVFYDSANRTGTVFNRELAGKTLSFYAAPLRLNAFIDTATSSEWNVEGLCVSGAMEGKQLTRIPSEQAQWYGWSAYFPQTTIYSATQ